LTRDKLRLLICEFLEKKLAEFFPRSLFVSARIFRRKSRG
jgi:hypothetical protein